MAKIKLGSAPKTFKHRISFPLLQGGRGEIVWQFKYRTKLEFAAFIAEIYPAIKTPLPPTEGGFDVVDQAEGAQEAEVRYLMAAAEGWDLDEDFCEDSVRALIDEFPAAGIASTAGYREAITEGRTKN